MHTAASEWINQVACLAAGKDKPRQVCIGFHRATESLLADEGKSVCVVNQDEANGIRASVDPLTEIGDLVADCVNAAILLAAQPEDPVDVKGCLCFQQVDNIMEESGLAGGALACEKEMWKGMKAFTNLLEEGCLAEETRGEGGTWRWQQNLLH